jgi:hypothetical protein
VPFASPEAKSEKRWGMERIKNSTFSTAEHEDSTQERNASTTSDFVTPFTYKNGREISPGTLKKEAIKELTALYPYNFLDDTDYLVYQSATEKNIITKTQYSPLTRIPIGQQYATGNRFTMVRLPAGSSVPDTILTQEPVANAEFTNAVGEFKGSGINNLNEEEMDTPTQEIEEKLLKKALSIKIVDSISRKCNNKNHETGLPRIQRTHQIQPSTS